MRGRPDPLADADDVRPEHGVAVAFERQPEAAGIDIQVSPDGVQVAQVARRHPAGRVVPGGTLPAGGVTWVAVMPSHRRRGILTQFMQHQLNDLHQRGEPLAILWTSEPVIYGRFGYGVAAPVMSIEADRARFRLRDDPGATGA